MQGVCNTRIATMIDFEFSESRTPIRWGRLFWFWENGCGDFAYRWLFDTGTL